MISKLLQIFTIVIEFVAGILMAIFIRKGKTNEIKNEEMAKTIDDTRESKKTSNYIHNLTALKRLAKLQSFQEAERRDQE